MLSPATLRARAETVRADARRLRVESSARRAVGRRTLAETRRRRSRAVDTYAWLERTRELRYRSTWSDLPWQLPDADLDRVLVPHG